MTNMSTCPPKELRIMSDVDLGQNEFNLMHSQSFSALQIYLVMVVTIEKSCRGPLNSTSIKIKASEQQ